MAARICMTASLYAFLIALEAGNAMRELAGKLQLGAVPERFCGPLSPFSRSRPFLADLDQLEEPENIVVSNIENSLVTQEIHVGEPILQDDLCRVFRQE